MTKEFHVSQSIEGALKNWEPKTWQQVAFDNATTVKEVKIYFRKLQSEGKKLLPIGPKCEGFSYETGCPGHEIFELKES